MLFYIAANFFLISTLLLTLPFLIRYILIPYKKVHSYKQDDMVPSFFPVIGPFWSSIKNFKAKGDVCARVKEFSREFPNKKVLVTNLGSGILFLLRDTQYIKEFLQKPHLYHKHKIVDFLKPVLGNGLVTAEGDVWKLHRKIISASFHYEFIKANIGVIQDTTKEFLDQMTPSDYKDFPAMNRIQQITGEIIGRIFFGEHLNSYKIGGKLLTIELGEIVPELGACAKSPLGIIFGSKILKMSFIPRYRGITQRVTNLRNACLSIIQDRKSNPIQANDFLGLLLATQKAEDPQQRFSDEDIVNEFITFFLAGMDTTGHLCAMALYSLARYPECLEGLKEERDRTYNKEKKVSAETLQKMDALHLVFKETLRFYAPTTGSVLRTAVEDHKLVDLDIKKGDALKSESIAVYFDEKHFENPYKFDPNRWRNHDQKADPFAFIPFSAGPRNCIGQHLAILEAKVIVSELLERFEFKLKEGYQLRMTAKTLYEPAEDILFDLMPVK